MNIDDLEIEKSRFTELAQNYLAQSIEVAKEFRNEYITIEHLLYTIGRSEGFTLFCKDKQYDLNGMVEELTQYFQRMYQVPKGDTYRPECSWAMHEMLIKAQNTQKEPGQRVGIYSLIEMMGGNHDSFAHFMIDKYMGKTPKDLANELQKFMLNINKSVPRFMAQAFVNGQPVPLPKTDVLKDLMKMMSSLPGMKISSRLPETEEEEDELEDTYTREPWEEYVTCANDVYKRRNPVIGREQELERALRILCRKDKNNPIFLGEAGVGKTALVYGLARMLDEGNVPDTLLGMTIYILDMGALLAGTSFHGEYEKRIKSILDGLENRGNCILYIDDIHNMTATGGGNNTMSMADLVKPYMEEGSLRIIGSTTHDEYNKHLAKNKSISRRFEPVEVKEPSVDDTIQILTTLAESYERHHGVKYSAEAIQYAVEQSHALISDRRLPDKALDIMDEAGAYLQQHPAMNKRTGLPKRVQKVDVDLIKRILTEVCRIDAKALSSESNDDLKTLASRMSSQIYGQDAAIQQVVRSIMLSKAGLLEPEKPIASLLFVGPTGVGKTEVCKVLAQELGIELVRFDMSEYMEKHTVSKLIGSPAGYVGYEEGGQLTDAIRKTPNCVLLLDEIEKAHENIYNILLQVMDYAKLTDSKGAKVDFRHVILVMTSNAGAQFAKQASIGFAGGQTQGEAMLSNVKKVFKPEFLNRLSGTVVFNEMDTKMASLILDKKLNQLQERLKSHSVSFTLADEARTFLLEKGYTQHYGAREMDRVIQQYLTPLLMDKILFGGIKEGDVISINKNENGLSIIG